MLIFEDIESLRIELSKRRQENQSIGFVPTMGALHEGHISLVQKAKETSDVVVVSIFVNPTQFGPKEDLTEYPRNLESDSAFCVSKDVDILFIPTEQEIYPILDDTLRISYPKYTTVLCGQFRPGHFDGVLLVMAKLLNIVKPDKCFMGRKDGQQLILVEKLAQDLDFEVQIVGCPTLREDSGLAMSSRNAYLSLSERIQAEKIHSSLESVVSKHLESVGNSIDIEINKLKASGLDIQYFTLVNRDNLNAVDHIETGRYMLCVAVICGTTRLIDNYFIDVSSSGEVSIDRGIRTRAFV